MLDRTSDSATRVLEQSGILSASLNTPAAKEVASGYALAFGRVAEIYAVLDQATPRVLNEHDAHLRGDTARLAQSVLAGETAAAHEFDAGLMSAVGAAGAAGTASATCAAGDNALARAQSAVSH